MLRKKKLYFVRLFSMSNNADIQELERIKEAMVNNETPKVTILAQREFMDRGGNVFVYLEWTEG